MDLDALKKILDGERADDLTPEEAAAFEQLLRTSQPARDALAAAEDELAPLAERFEPPAVPPERWARVDAAVRAQAALPVPRERFRALPVWVAAAAALLLVVSVGFLVPLEPFRGGNAQVNFVGAGDPPPPPRVPVRPTSPEAPGALATGPDAGPGSVVGRFGAEAVNLEFDAERFEAGALHCNDLLCVYIRDKRL